MSTARKIIEAEKSVEMLRELSNDNFKTEFENFCGIISDMFLHFLDEYNVKFGLRIERISFEKFKTIAKRNGKIEAINFLIWYEKEYKKLKNNPEFGRFLEKEFEMPQNQQDAIKISSALLDETKKTIYYAYENF